MPDRLTARRLRRVLVAAAVAVPASSCLAGLLPALPANAATSSDVGLYGSQDPTYDGVYRQSLAIVGLVATGHSPDAAAVSWLLAQQCSDGAFTAYRADTSAACTPAAEDENATAMAIQALEALGKPTTSAVAALKRFQLADGGFYESTAFGAPASDANSTGLALSAFAATGVDATTVTSSSGKDGDDFLRSVQLPCSAATGAGGYDFQPEPTLHANDYATVQALLGELGKALPVGPATPATPASPASPASAAPTCPAAVTDAATSATAAQSYLAARLSAAHGTIPSSLGGGIDWTSTADAVIDLTAAGVGGQAADAGLAALEANAKTYAQSGGADAAGPLATMLLTAHATGANAASFGGLDLAAALTGIERTAAPPPSATPTPTVAPTATPTPTVRPTATGPVSTTSGPTLPMTGSRGVLPLSSIGGGLLALGALALALGRRRFAATGDE